MGVVQSSDLYRRSRSAAPASDMDRDRLCIAAAAVIAGDTLLLAGLAAAGSAPAAPVTRPLLTLLIQLRRLGEP